MRSVAGGTGVYGLSDVMLCDYCIGGTMVPVEMEVGGEEGGGVRGDEKVRTTVYIERWLVEAAKKLKINVSEVAREALKIAVSARSKSVRSRDVLRDERLIEDVRAEFQKLIEAEEEEWREALRRSEEMRNRIEQEREHRRQAERALQVRRLKAWLEKHESVRRELLELLRNGTDLGEARACMA